MSSSPSPQEELLPRASSLDRLAASVRAAERAVRDRRPSPMRPSPVSPARRGEPLERPSSPLAFEPGAVDAASAPL